MRISDWSSDVCSSDLVCPIASPASMPVVTKAVVDSRQRRHKLVNLRVSPTPQFLTKVLAMSDALTYRAAGVDIDAGNELVERIKPLVKRTPRAEEPGRASCRERQCPFV